MRVRWLSFFALVLACGDEAAAPSVDGGVAVPDGSAALDAGDASATDGGTAACASLVTTPMDRTKAPAVSVNGDPGALEGIFDPSLVFPAGAPGGAMAYSAVQSESDIRTRIAVSADDGASFTYVGAANASGPLSVQSTDTSLCPTGTCVGRDIVEVPSLVFDPDDPDATRRWKLFAHRYLVLPGTPAVLLRQYGYIALYTASVVQGPYVEQPKKALGWLSTSPFSSENATNLGAGLGLGDCVAFTEPSALVVPGKSLELALGCVYADASSYKIRVELLRSVDHGSTFARVATLLRPEGASCLLQGAAQVNAPELHFAAGKVYLTVSPALANQGYAGCGVFEVTDLGKGLVAPEPRRAFVRPDSGFIGACAYSETTGYLVPMLAVGRSFGIYRSGVRTP